MDNGEVAGVSDSIPDRVGIIDEISRSMRDGGAELQSLVSAPYKPGINPKSLSRAYDVEANSSVGCGR